MKVIAILLSFAFLSILPVGAELKKETPEIDSDFKEPAAAPVPAGPEQDISAPEGGGSQPATQDPATRGLTRQSLRPGGSGDNKLNPGRYQLTNMETGQNIYLTVSLDGRMATSYEPPPKAVSYPQSKYGVLQRHMQGGYGQPAGLPPAYGYR